MTTFTRSRAPAVSAHLFLAPDFDAAEQLGGLEQAFHESDLVQRRSPREIRKTLSALSEVATAVQITARVHAAAVWRATQACQGDDTSPRCMHSLLPQPQLMAGFHGLANNVLKPASSLSSNLEVLFYSSRRTV